MKLEIPTSPEVGQKIKALFEDPVLKPYNMELVKIEALSQSAVLVHIDCRSVELRDVFFLGYWTNSMSQLKK
jgi:hypothetical protein